MKLRAVLVGSYFGQKLYYLLDPYGDKNSTGALVDKDGNIEYLKFFSFVKSNPSIKEFRFSKFHRFLWDAPDANNKAKWNRIFVNGTQKVDEEMLIGAQVITDLSPKQNKKTIPLDRALQFKSLNASQNATMMPGSVLGRRTTSHRTSIGMKGIGRSIGNRPAIDGDGDGFVDDGLPTMRPFIPGFDFVLDAVGNVVATASEMSNSRESVRGGMNSGIVTRPQTVAERINPISKEQLYTTLDKARLYVDRTFNDGKPIVTKRDAIDVLSRHMESFANGDSHIQFLDELANDDDAIPDWARNYLYSFLLSLDSHPDSNNFNVLIKEASSGKDWEGQVSSRPGLQDFVRDPVTGRLKPQKKRRPLIVFEYKKSQYLTPINMLKNDADRKKFSIYNVDRAILDGIRLAKYRERGITDTNLDNISNLNDLTSQLDGLIRTLDEVIAINPNQLFTASPEILGATDSTWGAIADIDLVGVRINPSTNRPEATWRPKTPNFPFIDSKGRSVSFAEQSALKEFAEIMTNPTGATVSDARAYLARLRTSIERRMSNDNDMRKAMRKIGSIDAEFGAIQSGTVSLHESTHMLHNMSAIMAASISAQKLRQQIIDEQLNNLSKNGVELTQQVIDSVEGSISADDVYAELFVQRAVELARQDTELAKRRLLHSDFFSDDVLLPSPGRDLRSQDGKDTYHGWLDIDVVNDAVGQMVNVFVNLMSQNDQLLSDNQKLAKSAIRTFLSQPTYDGKNKILLGDELARVFNEMDSSFGNLITGAFSSNVGPFKSGDELTLGMISFLLNPFFIKDIAKNRNIFSGLKLRQYSALLDEIGFPDFEIQDLGGNKKAIRGLGLDESKKLSAALLNMRTLASQIPKDNSGIVLQNLSVRATTSLRLMPDGIVLPKPFSGLTKKQLIDMPEDEFLNKYKILLSRTLDEMLGAGSLYDAGRLLESGIIAMNWWDELDKNEVNLLIKIMKNVGLPSRDSEKSGSGYATYMGTLVTPVFPGFASPPKPSEFFAEFAIAEMFGVPITQLEVIADSSGTGTTTVMRALTDEEIAVINKFMNWLYPGGRLSQKLNTVQLNEIPGPKA